MTCETVVHALDRLHLAAQLYELSLRRLLLSSILRPLPPKLRRQSERFIKSDKVWPAPARLSGLPIGLGLAAVTYT